MWRRGQGQWWWCWFALCSWCLDYIQKTTNVQDIVYSIDQSMNKQDVCNASCTHALSDLWEMWVVYRALCWVIPVHHGNAKPHYLCHKTTRWTWSWHSPPHYRYSSCQLYQPLLFFLPVHCWLLLLCLSRTHCTSPSLDYWRRPWRELTILWHRSAQASVIIKLLK